MRAGVFVCTVHCDGFQMPRTVVGVQETFSKCVWNR